MAVKIRLTRLGKKKQPTYRVVVMDARKPRDGEYIEQLGIYDPRQEPSLVDIDNERALHWLNTGAQPTERAQKLLEISGAWTQFKVARGEIHTVSTPADAAPADAAPADAGDAVAGATAPTARDDASTEAVVAEDDAAGADDTEASEDDE